MKDSGETADQMGGSLGTVLHIARMLFGEVVTSALYWGRKYTR